MGIYNRHYDADGRLISDDTRNIARITYYPYQNLPKLVRFADGSSVVNSYSPSGTLMQRNFITRYVKTVTRVDRRTGDTTVVERATSLTERRLYRGAFERQGSKWLLHTGVGHYDLTEGKHYYYIKDNLGSTVAVVNQSGVAHQLTAYYPSGLPHDLTASEARTTDRLHIGNRWIDHKGMNSYDNTARMHYPVLPSFDTPDPLAEQFPQHSPYAHCAANPLMYVDPTGKIIEYDSNMKPEKRAELDQFLEMLIEQSEDFLELYTKLKASSKTYTFRYQPLEGDMEDLPGYFDTKSRDIIYNSISTSDDAQLEEVIHAYQYEMGYTTDKAINIEYEAKILVAKIKGQGDLPFTLANYYQRSLPSFSNLLNQIYFNPQDAVSKSLFKSVGLDFSTHHKDRPNYNVPVTKISGMINHFFNITK